MSEQELNKRRCIQYLTREHTEEERITFEIDLLFDEELKSTYETYCLLWKAYPTNGEIWQEAKQQSKRKKQVNTWYIRVACTILVLIGSFMMTYLLVQPTVNPAHSEYRIYTNLPGVRKQVTLEDGSVVVLNGQARLQYTQNDSMRLAWLEGEAFFDVVKNVNKKFLVKHEDLEIEVVGTQFSVNTLGQEKRVALLSGKVLAKLGNGEQLYLKPNEQLVWNTSLGEVKRFKTNAEQQMSWRNEKLIFDNTPLAQALTQINQFYGVTFVIQDPVFAQKRITGVFDQVTLDEFIQALAFVANCTITLNNTNYLIEPYAQYPLSKKQP
ncbi:transmembrane sensor [Myroides gitamensis]|uniref:FecR family protein n=1 Tax=Myroides odoratus TaxID=256 RepID=UPI002169F372|nr:FecR domain-containing protein [Myroides odoratus]MCS4238007.1 ferric-dicitrate binding protein FerR (iron transport regulator) [Myroides odoratus]MDH6600083.1 transmembrane sensor [Myroides gitamensis]